MDRFGPRFGARAAGGRGFSSARSSSLLADSGARGGRSRAEVGVVAALALFDRVRVRLAGHRHRRLRRRGARALGAGHRGRGARRRSPARPCCSSGARRDHARPEARLAARVRGARAALRAARGRRALVARARGRAAAAAVAAAGGLRARCSSSSAAPGALPILGFLVLYKFGENLATALIRPFLIQKCFVPEDVGLATATIGLVALIAGTFFGGAATERIGLTRCLWIFGVHPGGRLSRATSRSTR